MAFGDRRQDPKTGEPEIELADGSMVTDWNLLKGDPNRQMLPLGVGVVVPHFATAVPDDGWLPVSGGTFNDVDYPELAAAIAAGNTIGTDLADGTFRLLNLNSALSDGRGRVLEGLGTQTPGEFQADATAPNGTHLRTSSAAGGNVFNAQTSMFTNTGSVPSQGSVLIGGGDPQTRAPAVSILWMVRAKPWTHAGDVTINPEAAKTVLITGSLGSGAGGTVNVPLTDGGKALLDVAMKLSNGTSFSPPLDTNDGTNRWWYDFDHTTGEITTNRFGAFTGGAYRIVAYYA